MVERRKLTKRMEDQLKELTSFDDRGIKWAKEAKKKGQKVIGVMDSYLPQELVMAHGLFPWLATGRPQLETPIADKYHGGTKYCGYCNHVIEAFERGELDFVDGLILTDWDDDHRRFGDVVDYWDKLLVVEVHLPFSQTTLFRHWFEHELVRLSDVLAGFSGRAHQAAFIDQKKLLNAISVCNKTRQLLRRLYQLRKRPFPPLTGGEYLNILLNSQAMPKEVFNAKLEEVLPQLERQEPARGNKIPRVLVSSDFLHLSEYLDAIESCGCIVAMSDFDLDRNFVWKDVEEEGRNRIAALADVYFAESTDSRMGGWDGQMQRLIAWVKEFDIDGVIQLRQAWSRPREMRTVHFLKRLSEANIPAINIERDYSVANIGQLKTRVGAFLEMLGGR